MTTEVQKFGEMMTRVIHEPGNATRYEAVGTKMPRQFPEVGHLWLIFFPATGGSYYFREGAYTTVSYVASKLGFTTRGTEVPEVDLHEMTKCITTITGGRNDAATDSKGSLPDTRLLRIAQ